MSNELYCVPTENIVPLSEWLDGLDYLSACDSPRSQRHFSSIWYCENSYCPAREVVIDEHHYGASPKHPPTGFCPKCRRPLRFVSYANWFRLVRVKADTANSASSGNVPIGP